MKLTQSVIRKSELPQKGYKRLWDSDIPGFGVRLYPNGKITFIYLYRINGRERQYTIGRNIDLPIARRIASEKALAVASGQCPIEQEKEARIQGMTFKQLTEKYKQEYLHKNNTTQTIRNYTMYLNYLEPLIGNLPIKSLKLEDFYKIQQRVKNEKGLRSSNLLITMLKRMFSLALDRWELIETDYCKKIKKYREKPRTALMNQTEIKKLMDSIKKEDDVFVRSFFLVLIHSMARRGELAAMKWDNIDLKKRIWIKPMTKTGVPHLVPLNESAVEIISGIPKVNQNKFVFVGKKEGRPINGFSKYWKRITERAELKGYTIHDIRRSMGSLLLQSGKVPIERISQILGHHSIRTTEQVYAKLGLESKQETVSVINELLS